MTNLEFISVNEDKVLAFEYVLKKLLDWNRAITGAEEKNDLSTLKAIKLLFFVTAVNTKDGSPNVLLTTVFNDFVAMPYGHVESDIYNEIKTRGGILNYYRINNSCTSRIQENPLALLDATVPLNARIEIDQSVAALKKINPGLITMSAFELVGLSHSWYSWKKTFSLAKSEQINSKRIPADDIINEDKIFSLEIF